METQSQLLSVAEASNPLAWRLRLSIGTLEGAVSIR
jgi:hypothetical protein